MRRKQLGDDWEEHVSDKRASQQCRCNNMDVQTTVLGTTLTDEQELRE